MDLNLEGRIALVTGGMSGIGRSIVAELLAEGCDVHVGDINPVAGSENHDASERRHPIRLDVGDAPGVQHAVDRIVQARGRIDILVNCAGILKTRPLVESTIADWDEVARVNLSGVYYCSKAVMPAMIRARYGKIVNIASVSSVKGGGQFGNVLYGTTKAGVVETAMTASLMTPDVRDRITEAIPLRRLIEPVEIARAVAYLASDVSEAITGQVLVVDRGFLVR